MAKKDSGFYTRMLEAKALKKKRLEQEQLAAEFEAHPERFAEPIIVKSESEQKLDKAFDLLRDKLHTEKPNPESALERAVRHLEEKAQGF